MTESSIQSRSRVHRGSSLALAYESGQDQSHLHANVTRHGDVGASVRLAHDGDDGDTTSCTDRFGSEPSSQSVLPFFRNGSEDIGQTRDTLQSVFLGVFESKEVETRRFLGLGRRR